MAWTPESMLNSKQACMKARSIHGLPVESSLRDDCCNSSQPNLLDGTGECLLVDLILISSQST